MVDTVNKFRQGLFDEEIPKFSLRKLDASAIPEEVVGFFFCCFILLLVIRHYFVHLQVVSVIYRNVFF